MSEPFIEVFATHKASDLAYARMCLDGEGIPYFVDGENFSQTYGMAVPVKIRVPASEAERARQILNEK